MSANPLDVICEALRLCERELTWCVDGMGRRGGEYEHARDQARAAMEVARKLREGAIEWWRPIATAPKDGTPIRIYADGLKDEDFNPSGSVEGFWQDGEGWLGAVWNPQHDYWMALPMKPTHWQPLPEPPSDTPQPDASPSFITGRDPGDETEGA